MKAKGGRKVQGTAVLVHWENLGLAATSATLCSYNQVAMKQTSYSSGLRTPGYLPVLIISPNSGAKIPE